jgi:hypothetical protein
MKLPESLPKIERTHYQATDPNWDDLISRIQIVRYLEEIPLNCKTEREHQLLEEFVTRAQRHFTELDPNFEPDNE